MENNKIILKDGLYAIESNLGTTDMIKWDVYAEEGWCFYDIQAPENYDEYGIYLGEFERVYRVHTTIPQDAEYVQQNIIPVKRKRKYIIQ